jgi:2',3'-cyclic-nucleotide 2'-phosphodiesterase (5'-nucleotidase family)
MFRHLRFYFGFIIIGTLLLACRHISPIEKVETDVMSIDTVSVVKEDTTALRIIKPFKEKMETEMSEVLAYTKEAMVKDKPEGVLNNFVADLVLKKANDYYKTSDGKKVDFCILNNGGLRASLPKGAITRGEIFELMPFDNYMIVITLSGEKVMEMCNFVAKSGGVPISGFSLGIKDTLAVNITVNGKNIDTTRNYRVVTSDYLANGGDKMKFFKNPLKTENLNIKLRDAILEYAAEENKKGDTLKSKLDNRIYYEK